MDGEEELLEVGARRGGTGLRVVAILLAAAAVLALLVLKTRGGSHLAAPPPSTSATASATASATTSATTAPSSPIFSPTANRPPWPQRPAACGGTSFVPLVSAAPLRTRTGVRALVGDRLTTVDVDSGAVRAAPRLPDHLWAFGVGVTGSGTYALLGECGTGVDGQRTEVARVLADGTLRAVSRGNYDQLLAGGNHPWAVVDDPLGDRSRVDPLDGGRTLALPTGFGALGGFGESLVGTVPGDDADTSFTIEVLDPRTGHVGVQLGPAVSVGMSHGVVLWTAPGCRTACRIYTYDLRSGQRATTVNPVPGVATVWSAVLSPDGHTVALVRERSDPGPYDPGHPGNPNELVTVDLRTGTLHQVPGLVLWSKSSPGVAFSPDSRWLVIGLDEGTDVRLLVWRPGLVGPLESPARLRYPVAYAPTVTALG